ncbi:MAG: Hpt domain-containing protein [Thermoplasmata archaeon]|nr:Hpt domain-containing protein [Thermoplasmata archaeon]
MAVAPLTILLVEDQPADAKLVELAVRAEPAGRYALERVDRVAAAALRLQRGGVGVVVTDLGLPDSVGTDGVARLVEAAPGVAVIVLSGSADLDRVRAALRAGAVDFQPKGVFLPGQLGEVIERGLTRHRFLAGLTGAGWTPTSPGPAWSHVSESAVVLVDGRVVLWSPAGAPYVHGADTSAPSLPERLQRELAPSPSIPSARVAATVDVRLGECLVEKVAGVRERIRFVGRTYSFGSGTRTYLEIRPASAASAAPTARTATLRSTTAREPPALDPAGWADLVALAGGNPGFVGEMVASFVPFAGGLVGDLRRAAAAHDSDALERAAHALKSSSSQVAALPLSQLCQQLEAASRTQHPPDPGPSVAAIEVEFRRVVEALNAARANAPDSAPAAGEARKP